MKNRWLFALIIFRTKPNKIGPFAGWPFGFFGMLRYLWVGYVNDFRIWHLGLNEHLRRERVRLDRALDRHIAKTEREAARPTNGHGRVDDRSPPLPAGFRA